jgi:hypothetical protein
MPKIPLRVIPEPEHGTRSVMNFTGEGTVAMRGQQTGHDYVCGTYGAVLLEVIGRDHVQDIVIKCASCGSFVDPSMTPPR